MSVYLLIDTNERTGKNFTCIAAGNDSYVTDKYINDKSDCTDLTLVKTSDVELASRLCMEVPYALTELKHSVTVGISAIVTT